MKTHPMWKTWSLSFLLTIGSTLRYFKGSHVDQPWCIWISSDIHIVAMGRIFSLLLTDMHIYSIIWHFQLRTYEKSLGLPGCQSKSAQVKCCESTQKVHLHLSWTNPTLVPASVTLFSHFPPMTRMSYCCSYPWPISPRVLGIPLFSPFQGFYSWNDQFLSITGSHCQLSNIFLLVFKISTCHLIAFKNITKMSIRKMIICMDVSGMPNCYYKFPNAFLLDFLTCLILHR